MTTIASWNVNSINVRAEQVVQWLAMHDIDVLAVQETKCVDEQFPLEPFIEAGWEVVISGQKSYNGMAFISKLEADDVITDLPNLTCPQRRILAGTFGDTRVLNLYVPNGEAVGSDKYAYKLDWLEKVHAFVQEEVKRYPKLVILGDFNIAPDSRDVCDPKQWQDKILVSEKERTAFFDLLALGFKDSFRLFEQEENIFSWWDYRSGGFRDNRGLRIDHVLLSNALIPTCKASYIDNRPRTWERPSDHAPAIVELS